MRQELLKFLRKQLKETSVPKLAQEIDIEYVSLWRIVHEKTKGNIEHWEQIDKYYKRCVKALGG